MKSSPGLVGVAIIVSGLSLREGDPGPKPSVYSDGLYGFSIEAPSFGRVEKGGTVIPVMLLGPSENKFASNVNVVVQAKASTRAAFRALTLEEFRQYGFKVNSDREVTVSGRDAIIFDYEGTQQGRDLRFLALAVIDKERVFVVTCTAPKELYKTYETKFQACLDTFKVTD